MGFEPDRAFAERRRSPRIVCSVPLRIDLDDGVTCDAITTDINREGAFILSSKRFRAESRIKITNIDRGSCRPFRVVWCSKHVAGVYKLGVELLPNSLDFWGSDYQPQVAQCDHQTEVAQ